MAGINIKDLPQSLQQKLQPYVNIAKDVDSAISMAKQAGKWTAADDKAYSALNGDKAWGMFDGFEKSKELAQAAEESPLKPFETAAKKAIAKDVQKNPSKYTPKRYDMKSGRYVVYQKSQETGKDSYTYYDVNGKKMTAEAFKNAENLATVQYDAKSGKLATSAKPREKSTGEKAGETLLAIVTLPLTLFASCSKGDDITEFNFTNENKNVVNITFDTASLLAAMNELTSLLAQINNNTAKTNEELAAIKNRISEIQKQIATIIANQQDSAANAEAFYKQILEVCRGNQELLKFLVGQMTENNDTLKQIKELMEKNNASLEEILEAVSKCKYAIESGNKQNHADLEDVKKLITALTTLISKLPNELKDKFSEYFKSIIVGIADNGAKLDALYNLLAVVNQNVQSGHTAILNKMEKMQAILDALFQRFGEFDAKITNMLNAIATAIADMAAKDVDLNKIQSTLEAILDKIGNDKAQMEQITKLLQAINANTVINGQTQLEILDAVKNNKVPVDEIIKLLQAINANTVINGQTQLAILDAIKKLDGNMTAQFAKLIEIGSKNNDLQEKANKLIEAVLEAIKKLKIEPGSQTQVDLEALIDVINANSADLSSKLSDIYTLLMTINANVIEGDSANNEILCKILQKLSGKTESPDFSAILAKLDEILKAIKDHKVTIDVTGKITVECNCGNGEVHEGVIDDLDWILG